LYVITPNRQVPLELTDISVLYYNHATSEQTSLTAKHQLTQ